MEYQGIIFDFNGTLFFDNDKHVKAGNEISKILRGKEITLEELHTKLNGTPNIQNILYFTDGKATKEELEKYSQKKEEYYRQFCKEDQATFHLVKGAEEYFDYLKEYCKVVYLPRTEGISSTQIRNSIEYKLGAIGTDITINKFKENAKYINGLVFNSTYFDELPFFDFSNIDNVVPSYDELLKENDIIYVATRPEKRYDIIKKAY